MRLFPIPLVLIALCGCGSDPRAVRVGVGGQAALRFFPVYLARELGLYEKEGLDVSIQDLAGSAKSMQALIGGSADAAAGFYDQTIQMAAEGRQVRSFLTMTRCLGFVVVVSPATKKSIRQIADLKGAVVGVAAPGSSGHLLLNYLLKKHGLAASDVSVVGFGSGASSTAALERGTVDVGVVADFVVVPLQRRKPDLVILADTRSREGIEQTFGVSEYPGSVLYATSGWLDRNPGAAKSLVRAVRQAMEWARGHTPEEVAAKLAKVYPIEDQTILVESLRTTIAIVSADGLMPASAPPAVRQVLSLSMENVRNAQIELASTYTNDFIAKN